MTFASGSTVDHKRFGVGAVELDKGETSLVRFAHGFEECLNSDLDRRVDFLEALRERRWSPALPVVTRVQAAAIRSTNDQWGVFSRSRIALLPHQLWVCRRVRQEWPTRWLIADDVGLGKTVEAGLILLPLLSSGLVRRLLVLCPANLVEQWQQRMREMFDIRLARYVPGADTPAADFWGTAPTVVASFHTLRLDRLGRHERLLSAEPWDLVIVDEAHHLNADEKLGPTQAYSLVQALSERQLIQSMLFFTGTPHRGKNFGFLSLLHLLRPDLFSPKQPIVEQLSNLRSAVIRNNKHTVTDMAGRRIFTKVTVHSETFDYSAEETQFYEMLTEFILTGKAYASTLSLNAQQTVILVLITMQKLASSSIAAVRKALNGRLNRLSTDREKLQTSKVEAEELRILASEGDIDAADRLSSLEERIADLISIELMEDEEPRIKELLQAADAVAEETKVRRIVDMVAECFHGESILFFTEYKATQALLMSALQRSFGNGCVTFINGDGFIEGVLDSTGRGRTISVPRAAAAEAFNGGTIRFLVSTEAAAEGIDLQERCSTLVHVDLPWNPMRLHQRVGRLSRYGQVKPVEVYTFRNPATVESRIWEKLNGKLESIMQTLGSVMDEPEDLLQLVLGMSSSNIFTELFSEAQDVDPGRLSAWFDAKTTTFGGIDAIDAVKNLVGNVQRFDFGTAGGDIPRADLGDLKSFFLNMLALNGRRVQQGNNGIGFKTPDPWLRDFVIRGSYTGLVFDRTVRGREAAQRVLGVGHRLFEQALLQAESSQGCLAVASTLPHPLLVYVVRDRVTATGSQVRRAIVGVAIDRTGKRLLRDWQVLQLLNELEIGRRDEPVELPINEAEIAECEAFVVSGIPDLKLDFRVPEVKAMAVIWPRQ